MCDSLFSACRFLGRENCFIRRIEGLSLQYHRKRRRAFGLYGETRKEERLP